MAKSLMDTYWNRTMISMRLDMKFVVFAVLAVGGLSACDMNMYHETYITPKKMEVREERFYAEAPASEVSDAYLQTTATIYEQSGRGPLQAAVTYDPGSSSNTAKKASGKARVIADALHANGVDDVDVSIMPVVGQGDESQVLFSYDSYKVTPPDCALMPGMETTSIDPDPTYRLGCSVSTVLAKQIARPKDLAGQVDANTTSDGRRAAKIVEIYRAGSKDKKLEGESASGK